MIPNQPLQTLLKRRAQLMADVRLFFAERAVMEVDTPVLSQAAPTAPYLDSFETSFKAGTNLQTRYLHTSPEFAMKRLLAAGSGPIYQIAKVFRNGELGRLHSAEFVMLEWYRPGFTLAMLMTEVDALMQYLADTKPAIKITYHQLFEDHLNVDCFACSDKTLQQLALDHLPALPHDWQADRDGWLEILMSEFIEPRLADLDRPVMVYDFPASQAQLAKCSQSASGHRVAERFELYAGGMELANGYDELCDAAELRQRFERDNQQRQQHGKPVMPVDEHLLAAMQTGLPQCSGVALGLDRLLMLLTQQHTLEAVQSIGFADS